MFNSSTPPPRSKLREKKSSEIHFHSQLGTGHKVQGGGPAERMGNS